MKRFGRKKGTHGDVQTGLHLQVPREPPPLSIAADAYPQPTSCRRRADARQCALKPHTCPAPTRTPPAERLCGYVQVLSARTTSCKLLQALSDDRMGPAAEPILTDKL
uniref:Uncharacterized protein n=1 Tax=Setaria viridis TaxID=4556 RepID=A0A4U6U808_SETVI|nr:hypothetical protein SEVIR_6G182401v2 [Setaria viridis]